MHTAGRPARRAVLTGGLAAAATVALAGCSSAGTPRETTAAPEPRPDTPKAAIEAAYKSLKDGTPLPGNLQAIVRAVEPVYRLTVENPGADPVDTMIHNQIRVTPDDLRSHSDLAPLVKKGALAVVGAYYSLDTGKVDVLTGAPV
ncbi:hypothetical protein ACFY04_36415 [Streptomyces sp. NPDC001549]|uniref:hypothetical protein n=1 Tax=Streptomyces sp. NPDC001549 TaxID=3364586 RepID=UPI0036CB98B4